METSKLGTSLENLLARHRPAPAAPAAPTQVEEEDILKIPLSQIKPNPSQPRIDFNEESFQELVQSVKVNGIIQPIVVRRVSGGFELIAGERRWRAARAAGLVSVSAQVKNADSAKAFELAMIENIQRQDLNPIERANGFKKLIDLFDLTQEMAAQRLGINRSTMANIMRLLELPPEIQDAVSRGTISTGHARALLALHTNEERLAVWRKIEKDALSVRQVEKIVTKEPRKPRRRRGENKAAHIRDLEEQLRGALGTKTTILPVKENTGKIIIDYYSLDDFDRVIERILDRRTPAKS